MMDWSPQQREALDQVGDWLSRAVKVKNFKGSDVPQVFYLGGYAGTGKSTLAKYLVEKRKKVFGAYTGKAAVVMQKSGCDGASTLHSIVYNAKRDPRTGKYRFEFNSDSPCKYCDVIVVDEVSMVGDKIGSDLLRYNKPILVLGDPAQLPPIKSGGFFTARDPDIMLTEIHRQAENNPIIRLAAEVRAGGVPAYGSYGLSSVIDTAEITPKAILDADQVLVGRNRTREQYNERIRELKKIDGTLPIVGDRLVCLKNDHALGIFNGGIYRVEKLETPEEDRQRCVRLIVRSEDFPDADFVDVTVRKEFFTGGYQDIFWKELMGQQQFTFGYALTVHKSQGSQWDNVVLFDQSKAFGDQWSRWLYTGITRAAERITIVR